MINSNMTYGISDLKTFPKTFKDLAKTTFLDKRGKLKLSNQIKPHQKLDCLGLYCPEPVFRTRVEIDKLDVGQVLEVIADDPAAEEDIKRLVKRLGHQLIEIRKEGDQLQFLIKKLK
jgi:tRNA 2-thiouridine synthesizing protein A